MNFVTVDITTPESPKWSISYCDDSGAILNSTPLSDDEVQRLNALGNPKELDSNAIIECLSIESRRLVSIGTRRSPDKHLLRGSNDYNLLSKDVSIDGIGDELFVVTRENPVHQREDDGHLITVRSKTGLHHEFCDKWMPAQ